MFTLEEIAAIPMRSSSAGSSLEDIYHLYDVQREFGEQGQQAPVTGETEGFGKFRYKANSIRR